MTKVKTLLITGFVIIISFAVQAQCVIDTVYYTEYYSMNLKNTFPAKTTDSMMMNPPWFEWIERYEDGKIKERFVRSGKKKVSLFMCFYDEMGRLALIDIKRMRKNVRFLYEQDELVKLETRYPDFPGTVETTEVRKMKNGYIFLEIGENNQKTINVWNRNKVPPGFIYKLGNIDFWGIVLTNDFAERDVTLDYARKEADRTDVKPAVNEDIKIRSLKLDGCGNMVFYNDIFTETGFIHRLIVKKIIYK